MANLYRAWMQGALRGALREVQPTPAAEAAPGSEEGPGVRPAAKRNREAAPGVGRGAERVERMKACELQTAKRRALAELAVVEAARRYMAASLRKERNGVMFDCEDFDTLQELRDALAVHSRVRVR